MSSNDPPIFEFEGFRLDRRRRRLSAASGKDVRITAKAFDALVYFVEHPGQVIERAALMNALWPQTVVEENNLSQVIVALRRALGEHFIVTIKGRGYQFVADVQAAAHSATPDRSTVASELGSGSPAGQGSGANGWNRRPVARLAGYAATALLAIGVAVAAYWFGVPGRSSDALVQGIAPDPVLRYSEPPTANRYALDLYDSARNYEWHGGSPADHELAEQLYERAVEEDPSFALAWARLSILHNEMYWFGRDRSEARRERSREAAERALELDASLPEAHLAMGWYHHHVLLDTDAALSELRTASRSMPDDAETHWRIGAVHRMSGELVRALASFERAIELQPRDVRWRTEAAEVHVLLRNYAEAAELFDRVLDLVPDDGPTLLWRAILPLYSRGDVTEIKAAAEDPRFDARHRLWIPRPLLGWTAALYERDYETALAYLESWEDEAWSDFNYISKAGARGVTHELAGRPEEARVHFEQARTHAERVLESDMDDVLVHMALGEALAGLGEVGAARSSARHAIDALEQIDDTLAAPAQRLDSVLRVLIPTGAFDEAIEALDTYLSNSGVWSVEGLLPDPRLDPIRDDPRFAQLIEKHERR